MCNKLYLLIAASTLLLTNCSQTSDAVETPTIVPSSSITPQPAATATLTIIPSPTSSPTLTPELIPTKAQTLTSADSIQINLFRLVPPDFLGAGYYHLGLIMEDPDLKSAFESMLIYPFKDSQILASSVDRMITFSLVPGDPTQATMSIVYILSGDFAEVTLPELMQENEIEDSVLQDYQGFELMVLEEGDPFIVAMTIMDDSTIVWGEESGVKAVLDTALGLKSTPLADLGAALPQVLWAGVFNNCPQYEDLGCTAMVVPGLAQGSNSDISLLHVYQFEDLDLAASALDTILTDVESGNITQTGSIKIVGDIITQDGRFIILEDLLPIEEIRDVFE